MGEGICHCLLCGIVNELYYYITFDFCFLTETIISCILFFTGDELWYLLYHIPLVNVSLPRKLPDLVNLILNLQNLEIKMSFPNGKGKSNRARSH